MVPGQQGERREEREPGRPGQDRQSGDQSRSCKAVALGKCECTEDEQEEQRLAVDGLEEECHWKHGEVENAALGALSTQALFGEAIQEEERAETAEQGDDDSGEDVVAEEGTPETSDQSRVERVKCSGRAVVAVLCDVKEEVAVPAGPDVCEVAQVVQPRRVPTVRVRMPIRLEEEEGEDRRDPDRRAAPEVDVEHLPLTRAHGRMIILSNAPHLHA